MIEKSNSAVEFLNKYEHKKCIKKIKISCLLIFFVINYEQSKNNYSKYDVNI